MKYNKKEKEEMQKDRTEEELNKQDKQDVNAIYNKDKTKLKNSKDVHWLQKQLKT